MNLHNSFFYTEHYPYVKLKVSQLFCSDCHSVLQCVMISRAAGVLYSHSTSRYDDMKDSVSAL